MIPSIQAAPDPLLPTFSTLNLSRLEQQSEPVPRVLTKLIHECSPDPSTRTATTAALVLSLWQVRGQSLTEHVPSLILLNAGEAPRDPIDVFIRGMVEDETGSFPDDNNDRLGMPIDKEKAPQIMANAVFHRRDLRALAKMFPFEGPALALEMRYQEALRVAYGKSTARAYSKAWIEQFGLVTDETDGALLRLNQAPDQVAFRHDLLDDPGKLVVPTGIGRGLETVPKSVWVSGSMTLDHWDEKLVEGVIRLGRPILFVPHTAPAELEVYNRLALHALPTIWREAGSRARTFLDVLPNDWFEAHIWDVRRRLHLLPGPGTYEFAVLQILHQLTSVCDQIARHRPGTPAPAPEFISALFFDLLYRSFRGVALGVAALAWHGFGFDPGCPRDKATKVLNDLRAKGSMSRSDILRYGHLQKEQRDLLLERLAAEDLVHVDGKQVVAATFAEFVTALHSRRGLPEAPDHRKSPDPDTESTA